LHEHNQTEILCPPLFTPADDYAPPAHKSTWFAVFYLCIPVGFALGYIVGGIIGPALGWRAAFLLEGAAMIPFVTFALMAQVRIGSSAASYGFASVKSRQTLCHQGRCAQDLKESDQALLPVGVKAWKE
jgi:MFS family permease